mmetsp:Transcript_22200/g.48423  ORF Transcript_22200/g.48423 Transcript_22200/m.48423 type:complete len:353 (-) Transcript_22200:584-1642(-)
MAAADSTIAAPATSATAWSTALFASLTSLTSDSCRAGASSVEVVGSCEKASALLAAARFLAALPAACAPSMAESSSASTKLPAACTAAEASVAARTAASAACTSSSGMLLNDGRDDMAERRVCTARELAGEDDESRLSSIEETELEAVPGAEPELSERRELVSRDALAANSSAWSSCSRALSDAASASIATSCASWPSSGTCPALIISEAESALSEACSPQDEPSQASMMASASAATSTGAAEMADSADVAAAAAVAAAEAAAAANATSTSLVVPDERLSTALLAAREATAEAARAAVAARTTEMRIIASCHGPSFQSSKTFTEAPGTCRYVEPSISRTFQIESPQRAGIVP